MLGFASRTGELLAAIDRLGSVSAAARAVGLDPSNALRHVRTAETRAGARLLDRSKGGAARGGARLTPAARRILAGRARSAWVAKAGAFDEASGTTPLSVGRRVLYAAGRVPAGAVEVRFRPEDVALARLAPGGSSRNRLVARVDGIVPLPDGTWRVRLAAGDLAFEAALTRGAVRELRLRPGSRVVAAIKATALTARPI